MPAKRIFTDDQLDTLFETLEKARKKFDNQEDMALALGLTQPSISALLKRKWSPGISTARTIAQLAGKKLEDLIGDFHPEPEARPAPGGIAHRHAHHVLENLEACIRFYQGTRNWSPWTIAAAQAGFYGSVDPLAPDWAEKLDFLEKTLERARKAV